jgi:GMP synthase-like glutamine amidotransferase
MLMRINVLQHTPNEGPGAIKSWSRARGHEMFIYHPYQFEQLPKVEETDFLVILGGPMSPNDPLEWIEAERNLIKALLAQEKPIFGACFGAQQIAMAVGSSVTKAPYKEVGWAPVYLQSQTILNIPKECLVLHWHEEMFELPPQAEWLFSSKLVKNQGFLLKQNVIGLQFHFEPEAEDLREIVTNDGNYAEVDNALKQTPETIITQEVPRENQAIMFKLLDFITQ